jgi:hypothetical protein
MDRIKDTNTHQNTELKRIANEKRRIACQCARAATQQQQEGKEEKQFRRR